MSDVLSHTGNRDGDRTHRPGGGGHVNCTHAPGEGMCRECAPAMFPTDEQMARHELWFARYHKKITHQEYVLLLRELSARELSR